MFHSARITLTAWYLLIIMTISIFFSILIYNVSTRELERLITRAEFRRIHPDDDMPFRPPVMQRGGPSLQDLENSKKQVLTMLVILNGGIFLLAGTGGYFLAGRTLRPIQEMVDDQNQFISSASHELRTPIATMRAEMEGSLLEKRIDDKKARSLIGSNLEELSTLQVLTNNLLKLAQVHNFTPPQFQEQLLLKEVLEAAAKKVLPLAKKKQIVIVKKIADQTIMGEKNSLTEAFVVFLDNAVKYSPEKSEITISTEKHRKAVKVVITDQGIGIAKKDLPHIFDRFYRANTTEDGFGLGLSIAKKTIELHGGSISVKSIPTKGTTFTILFPV
jgi:signal transduction histidine kinase